MKERIGWITVTLNDIAKWGSGGTPKSTKKEYYGGDIPWLIIGDLNDGLVWHSTKKITDEGLKNSSAKIVAPNNILIALYGSIGKLGINKIPVATNQAIAFTQKIHTSTNIKYLFYFLLFSRQDLYKLGKGGTQRNISQTVLKKVKFPLPPFPEQRAIVNKIEQLFSELDNGIANLKLAQEQLKVYRQAVLKQAFTGELTRTWREEQSDLPDADELVEEIRREREKTTKDTGNHRKKVKIDVEEEVIGLPDLPFGWKWVKLHEICSLKGGVTKGRKLEKKDTIFLPYLRVANVQDGYLDLSEIKYIEVLKEDLEKYRLIDGDVLYTEGGDKDKLGRGTVWKEQIVDCIHQNHVFRARPFFKSFSSSYIGYFSQTEIAKKYFFKKGKQTVNLASINITVLSNLPFPLCSLPEQQAIVTEIETRLSVCDKLEQDITDSLEKAEALRQSILKQAFEGKLLNEQELTAVRNDPEWEPAEALLAKIKSKTI